MNFDTVEFHLLTRWQMEHIKKILSLSIDLKEQDNLTDPEKGF